MSTHARLTICILVATGTLAGGASSYAGGKGGGGARIGGGSRSMRSIPQGGVKSSLPKVIQGGKTLPTVAQPKVFKQPTTIGSQGSLSKLPTPGQNGMRIPSAGSTAGKLSDPIIKPRLEGLNTDAAKLKLADLKLRGPATLDRPPLSIPLSGSGGTGLPGGSNGGSGAPPLLDPNGHPPIIDPFPPPFIRQPAGDPPIPYGDDNRGTPLDPTSPTGPTDPRPTDTPNNPSFPWDQLLPLFTPQGGGGPGSGDAPPAPAAEPPASGAPPAATDASPTTPPFPPAPKPDLIVTDVRLVDVGLAEKELGPRFRIFIENAGEVDVRQSFEVALLAVRGRQPDEKSPKGFAVVENLSAGKSLTVDIRLPRQSLSMIQTEDGQPRAFDALFALVDTRQQCAERDEENNLRVIEREQLQLVDLKVAHPDAEAVPAGSTLTLLGEGFGPRPGHVVIEIGSLRQRAEIDAWGFLGARVKVPELVLEKAVAVKVSVVRVDGQSAGPFELQIAPQEKSVAAAR